MFKRIFMVMAVANIGAVGTAHADTLQDQLVAAMRATPADGLAFRRTIVNEQTGSARRTIVEQYDPRKAPADRWTLLSIDGRAPTAKEAQNARSAKRGPVPSYAHAAKWFGAPATRSDGPAGTVIYRFATMPKGTMMIQSHDASPDSQVEAVVNTRGKVPFVERMRVTSNKPFRIMLVASVQSILITSQFRQLPDGTVVPSATDSDLGGSMLGKSGAIKSQISYDFQPR